MQRTMRRGAACLIAGMLGGLAPGAFAADGAAPVRVHPDEAQRRVDVAIDGRPFTAYVWPETLKKPVLNPLRSARGTLVTRGFPLDPRPGERVDHPHHVGLWFNYGDVNGVDFWNHSDAVAPADASRMGTIRHRAIVEAASGSEEGRLTVDLDWLMPDGSAILQERTTFVFRGAPDLRSVDRITTLTALDRRVALTDNKEGLLGLRVARSLEQPSKEPQIFVDASGKPTAVPVLDNAGVTGLYRSSEGKTGDAVWGTRGRWVSLSGTVEKEPVTIAILDHPKNPGFPTYWHARGYGLFAANPLGQAALSGGKETLDFTLAPGAGASFRYRLDVLPGPFARERAEALAQVFAGAGGAAK